MHLRWTLHPVLATLAGVLAGGLVIALVEACGHRWLGPIDPRSPQPVPAALFGIVLLGWVLGAAAAGAAATWTCARRTPRPGIAAGLVLLAVAGLNMASFAHPAWVVAASALLMPAAAWWSSHTCQLRQLRAAAAR